MAGAVHDWATISRGVETLRVRASPIELVVFRHARTTSNEAGLVTGRTDVPLSEAGRRSAHGMTDAVPTPYDAVICSGLARTHETARLALGHMADLTILTEPRLDEVDLGDMEGQSRREVPEFRSGNLDHAPTGGETYRQAAPRILSAVVDLHAARPDGGPPTRLILFSHAGVMRVLATLDGTDWTPVRMFDQDTGNARSIVPRSERMMLPAFWSTRAP